MGTPAPRPATGRGLVRRRAAALLASAALVVTAFAGPAHATSAAGPAAPHAIPLSAGGLSAGELSAGGPPAGALSAAARSSFADDPGPAPAPVPAAPEPLASGGLPAAQAIVQKYQADAQAVQTRASALGAEQAPLEQRAGDAQTTESNLAAQASNLAGQANTLNGQAEALTNAIAAHNAAPHVFQLPAQASQLAAYNEEKANLDAQKANLQNQFSALTAQNNKLQADQSQADANQAKVNADIQTHNDAVAALQSDISNLAAERQADLAQIADLLQSYYSSLAQSGSGAPLADVGGDQSAPAAAAAPPPTAQALPSGGGDQTAPPAATTYTPVGTAAAPPPATAAPSPAAPAAAAPPPVIQAPVTVALAPATVSQLPASQAANLNPAQTFAGVIPEANGNYAAVQVQPPPGTAQQPAQKAFGDAVNNGGKASATLGGKPVTIDRVVPVTAAPAVNQGGDVARPAKAAPRTAPPAWAPPLKASPVAGPPVSVGAVRAQLGQRGLGAQAGQYDLEYQPVVLDANGNPVAAAALTDAQGNPQLGATGKPVIRFSDLGLQNSDAALSAFAQAVINGQQAANRDDSPCPGHSFSGATRVLMGDGSTEPIAAVKAGDLIENARPGGGTEVHRVDQVHVTTTDTDFTDVVVEAGGAGGTVTGTWNHPYYDASAAAFVPAGALHAGEHLQSSSGTPATVAEVRPHFGPMVTFDLTVDGLHTYFVLAGRTPVLVHNCATTIAIADRLKSQVDLLHKLLPPSAQNRRSTAVIQAVDGNGNLHNVVGWSGTRTLDPLIRNALGDGEVMADRMAGDAEVSALNTIKDRGWTPIAGAANRPVCPWCQNTLFDDFSPTVGPARLVGPATPTRINGIRSTPGGTPLLGQSEFVWD